MVGSVHHQPLSHPAALLRWLLGALTLLIWAAAAAAEEPPAPPSLDLPTGRFGRPATAPTPTTARLLADTTAVRPGRAFQLGVLFEMAEGWHIYWKSPGEAGMATSVEFELPKGFTASPIRWPVPQVFRQEGDIVTYGYDKSVLLTVEVQPPAELPAGAAVRIAAQAQWMACKVRCVLGEGKPELALPVSDRAEPANAELFSRWRGRLPVAAGPGAPATARVSGQIAPGAKSGRFNVYLTWQAPPLEVQWIPAAGDALAVDDVEVKTVDRRTRVSFTLTALKDPLPQPQSLEALAVAAHTRGPRQGVLVTVPLHRPVRPARPTDSKPQ